MRDFDIGKTVAVLITVAFAYLIGSALLGSYLPDKRRK